MLKFSKGNAKLGKHIYTFSLLSGWTCPGANECLSKVVIRNDQRKVQDGPHTKFRCYSASEEALFPNTYNSRKHNTDLLKQANTVSAMSVLIQASLPNKADIVRIHAAGDFFNQRYFDAWLNVAKVQPNRLFYAYTKALKFWVASKNKIPNNFVLTASYGGRYDHLISEHNLRWVKVVYTKEEAERLGLEIDHDDSHAMKPGPNFALLIHGTQPAGSEASLAKTALKGEGSYSRKKGTTANV